MQSHVTRHSVCDEVMSYHIAAVIIQLGSVPLAVLRVGILNCLIRVHAHYPLLIPSAVGADMIEMLARRAGNLPYDRYHADVVRLVRGWLSDWRDRAILVQLALMRDLSTFPSTAHTRHAGPYRTRPHLTDHHTATPTNLALDFDKIVMMVQQELMREPMRSLMVTATASYYVFSTSQICTGDINSLITPAWDAQLQWESDNTLVSTGHTLVTVDGGRLPRGLLRRHGWLIHEFTDAFGSSASKAAQYEREMQLRSEHFLGLGGHLWRHRQGGCGYTVPGKVYGVAVLYSMAGITAMPMIRLKGYDHERYSRALQHHQATVVQLSIVHPATSVIKESIGLV